MNDLFNKNLGLAYHYANQFRGFLKGQNTIEFDDLLNVCRMSLFQTSQKFDETKNVKFVYLAAVEMKWAMYDLIYHSVNTVRIPSGAIILKKKIDKLIAEKDITIDELENFGIDKNDLATYNMILTKSEGFEDFNIIDPSTEGDDIDEENLSKLEKCIGLLTPDEQYILKGSMGIDGDRKFIMTMMKELNMSRGQVIRTREAAMKKLKEWMKE